MLHVFLRQVCVFILILNILYSNKMHKTLTKIKIKLSGKYTGAGHIIRISSKS